MSDKRRSTLVLFEIEGYSGQEISTLHGVPVKTVWTRLHHARKDLVAMVAAQRKQREAEAGKSIETATNRKCKTSRSRRS